MPDLAKYKENNRIEAKMAIGGLPESISETYSAFANAGFIRTSPAAVDEVPEAAVQS